MFIDGAVRPELVLLHYTATLESAPDQEIARDSLVMPPSAEPGRRETRLFLPSPRRDAALRLRYFFSTVGGGAEWFLPVYEVAVPGEDVSGDLAPVEEKGGGNLAPAAGLGMFRLRLPLRERRNADGTRSIRLRGDAEKTVPGPLPREIRHGRKRPRGRSSGNAVGAQEPADALFLYHVAGERGELVADKINCARLTLQDNEGEVVCARLFWGIPPGTPRNLSVMEVKKFASGEGKASDYFFAGDREAFLRARLTRSAGIRFPGRSRRSSMDPRGASSSTASR